MSEHRELVEAALAWWHAKRPLAWNEAQHRAIPTVNCLGRERELALAAAILAGKGEGLSRQQPIEITGVWLRGEGKDAVVLIEIDGEWVEVIREFLGHPDGIWPASHIVEPLGIRAARARADTAAPPESSP